MSHLLRKEPDMSTPVDQAELKFGQLLTIGFSISAYLFNNINILIILGFIFLLSSSPLRSLSPFMILYQYLIKPLHLIKSDYQLDNLQAHQFGQFIGALTVTLAVSLFYLNMPIAGWTIVFILVLLTAVSYSGWCIGCFLYYQLNRLGLKGFFKHKKVS